MPRRTLASTPHLADSPVRKQALYARAVERSVDRAGWGLREIDRARRPPARGTGHDQRPGMCGDDPLHDRQPEPRPLSHRFGRQEGLAQPRQESGRDPGSCTRRRTSDNGPSVPLPRVDF